MYFDVNVFILFSLRNVITNTEVVRLYWCSSFLCFKIMVG